MDWAFVSDTMKKTGLSSKDENKYRMYLSVQKIGEDNPTVIATVPAFVTDFTEFTAGVARIEALSKKRAEPITGIAENKQFCREQMCKAAAAIAGAVHSWATGNNNLEVAAKVDFSYSSLLAGRDRASAEKCQNVHKSATENLASLGEHGVTAAKLKALQTKIDGYSDCLSKPRSAIRSNKTATQQLEAEFAAADKLLNDSLDKLALQFEASYPQFFQDWQNARNIVDNAATRPGEEGESPTAKAA